MLVEQAIREQPGKCWVLVTIDGQPAEPDDQNHYTSKEKALEGYAARYRRYDGEELQEVPLLVPAELDAECMTIVTVCGYVLDEAGDGICHHHDVQELVAAALGMGWAILPDGRMTCCTDPRGCEACGAVLDGLPVDQGQIPGQLTIDGGEVAGDVVLPGLGPVSPDAQVALAELRAVKP